MQNPMDQVGGKMKLTHCSRRWFWAMGLLALLGCGQGGRVSVEGTVTLDGKPLKEGTVQFTPLAGTNGPTAGANIVDGKFVVPPQGGPFVGKFQVQITAAGKTGRKVPGPFGRGLMEEYKQVLPPRYNTASELKADVTANGPNHFDFALTLDKGSPPPSSQ
jgi:hypothetical protein